MPLNLILDIGNTRIKAGLFDKQGLSECMHFNSAAECIQKLASIKGVSRAIVCTVVDEVSALLAALPAGTLVFKSDTPVPIKNLYATQNTLGSDRLAAAIGARSLYPGQNCLVIDAGTCIKYNLVNKYHEYLGGAISPGLQMRLKALHQFTDRLPLIEFDHEYDTLVGASTRDSILSGVLNGALAEADGMINAYREQFPGLITVITGGDGDYFAKRLKNHIFAEPFLILKGLNDILIHNRDFEK